MIWLLLEVYDWNCPDYNDHVTIKLHKERLFVITIWFLWESFAYEIDWITFDYEFGIVMES